MCTENYSLSTNMLSFCLLMDVFKIKGYWMWMPWFACRHKTMGGHRKGRTGCVRYAIHLDVEDEHHLVVISHLMIRKSMMVVFGRPLLLQTSSIILSQMHVVSFSESVLHVGRLLHIAVST